MNSNFLSIERRQIRKMGHPVSKSSRKRPRHEIPAAPISSTHITDVNNDCLEHIFKKLDLVGLLNVADTSTLFKQAADQAFVIKYGTLKVVIDCRSPGNRISVNYGAIRTCGPIGLKLLRCFGHLIKRLQYRRFSIYRRLLSVEMDRYLNEYCVNSLIDIEFYRVECTPATNLKIPYSKVEKVTFEMCDFKCFSPDISKCFPSVRRLILCSNRSLPNIERNFPHLTHFEFDQTHHPLFRNQSLSVFMALNPQLRQLCLYKICFQSDADVLLSASKNLPKLESVDFTYYRRVRDFSEPKIYHFKSVREVKMHLISYNDSLPMLFEQLEELQLNLGNYALSEDIIDLIGKHPKLNKLKLKCNSDDLILSQADKMELFRSQPSLKELDLMYCTFTVDEAIGISGELKQLNEFRFKLQQPNDHQLLREELDKTWTVARKEMKTFDGSFHYAELEKLQSRQA